MNKKMMRLIEGFETDPDTEQDDEFIERFFPEDTGYCS